jgi:hypothetical protein
MLRQTGHTFEREVGKHQEQTQTQLPLPLNHCKDSSDQEFPSCRMPPTEDIHPPHFPTLQDYANDRVSLDCLAGHRTALGAPQEMPSEQY